MRPRLRRRVDCETVLCHQEPAELRAHRAARLGLAFVQSGGRNLQLVETDHCTFHVVSLCGHGQMQHVVVIVFSRVPCRVRSRTCSQLCMSESCSGPMVFGLQSHWRSVRGVRSHTPFLSRGLRPHETLFFTCTRSFPQTCCPPRLVESNMACSGWSQAFGLQAVVEWYGKRQ